MKDKRGQDGGLGLLIIFLAIIVFLWVGWKIVTKSNIYEDYKKDCMVIYSENFKYQVLCVDNTALNTTKFINCTKIDEEELDKYCFWKWSQSQNKDG